MDLHAEVGGTEACLRLSSNFYARVAQDPVLRPLFPGKTFSCAIKEFAAFLVQFLSGPAEDTQFRWWVSLRESHGRFAITAAHREAWMHHMTAALAESAIPDAMRSELRALFQQASAYLVNTGPVVSEAAHPHGEVARRWDVMRLIDDAIAAIRRNPAEALPLVQSAVLRRHFAEHPPIHAAFLAEMLASRSQTLLAEVRRTVHSHRELVGVRFNGRTLLHKAAGAGDAASVRLLLGLGADPNALDGGDHAPLYSVANECRMGGGEVVRILVKGGAEVDARGGVKRCTALHMAARRGNVEIAAALLDCGADLERRDSLGVSPLRRAVNCRQQAVADFLRSRGAAI